ncbi:MAG: hypothetical protein IJS67_01775 [Clostridia bacterium]|nr:hypothetical protein [Clostridia bacterium]
MKDFNDYEPKKDAGSTAISEDAFNLFSRLAAKYEGKSGGELMKAIIEEAENGRKRGTLTDEDIDKFAQTISPMLSDGQKKILNTVVAKIKKK